MPIIDLTYFQGEILIAQRSQLEVQEDLNALIAKYERKVLTDLFGPVMYAQFMAGIAVTPTPEPRWTNLKNGVPGEWMGLTNSFKLSLIANYVYYHWCRKEHQQMVGIGTVEAKTDNARKVAPTEKYVRAWNEMVDWICELHGYILAHPSDYPDYQYLDRPDLCKPKSDFCYHYSHSCGKEKSELFRKINSFGL